MTPEAQRIAIHDVHRGHSSKRLDYLNDLNAMHEAEKVLNFEQDERGNYLVHLAKLTNCSPSFATAAQRAEAFLKALGLWETK